MSEILSQSEIDKLIQSLTAGDNDKDEKNETK
jgi:flagellar motor switch protein FliM